jgi:peptidyl-dipeptidase Dcp
MCTCIPVDAFESFVEAGDIFHSATSKRLRKYIYSTGNSLEPGEAFRLFRGRDPVLGPMLKKKGLLLE